MNPMTVAELISALQSLDADLAVFFTLPDRLDVIISSRGQLPVTGAKVGPAAFGQLAQLTTGQQDTTGTRM